MVEKVEDKDVFSGYRDEPIWTPLKLRVANIFPGAVIPANLEPHLIEWATIKTKVKNKEIKSENVRELERGFSDSHDEFFDNPLFIVAIRSITETVTSKSSF